MAFAVGIHIYHVKNVAQTNEELGLSIAWIQSDFVSIYFGL